MNDPKPASPFPLCEAWVNDLRAAFTPEQVTLKYAKEGDREWGEKGEEGVQACRD